MHVTSAIVNPFPNVKCWTLPNGRVCRQQLEIL